MRTNSLFGWSLLRLFRSCYLKDRTFFFQIGEGKYKPGLAKIIILNYFLTRFTSSNYVMTTIGEVASSRKNFGSKNFFWSTKLFDQKFFCKHRLSVTIRFIVCSDIADFSGVLLVTWVIRTPNPLNSTKSPWVVNVSNFSPADRFWWGVLVLLVVTGVKQSRLLV